MRPRIPRIPVGRPSPAMVVALIALFVALGGTAAAAYVVSSNDQIAPATVSGANPPTGKHANVIGGSLGTSDLHNLAVTNAKLALDSVGSGKVIDDSITGADIKESTLATVPRADTLDGLDSTAFVKGPGTVTRIEYLLGPNQSTTSVGGVNGSLQVPGFGQVFIYCPPDPTSQTGQISYLQQGSTGEDAFLDSGGPDPTHRRLSVEGDALTGDANPAGDLFTFQVSTDTGGVATIWASYIAFTSFTGSRFCRVQAEAVGAP